MARPRSFAVVATVLALSLVGTACAKEKKATVAASCTPDKLKGFALRAGTTSRIQAAAATRSVLAQAKPVVKIGMFGDLTGANSGLVLPIRDAAKLAVEQANAKGNLKVTLELAVKDNKDAKKDTAPPIEQGFIDDTAVVGVLGGAFSGETLAVGNLFSRAGLVHISASATNPEITTKGWPFFRALSTDDVQAAKMVATLKGIGCTKIAVIDDKSDYGKGLADLVNSAAQAAGLTVVAREGAEQKTTDYGPLVDTLIAKAPEAVFYGGYYNDGSLILKQMREKGLKALFACGDGCKDEGLIKGATAANAEGAVLSCPCLDPNVSTDADAQKLAADFKAKYNKPIGIYGAEAFDVINIFVAAIDASDDDGTVTRKEVLDWVKTQLKDFKGVSKTFNFDEKGEVKGGSIKIYAVKGGKVVLLGEAEDVV